MELFFQAAPGINDGVLGMIMVIHTFGDYARFHPHLHAIVADGLFRPDGAFYCLPNRDSKELEEIFRSKVPAMLKGEGKINDELIEKLMNWRHSGFSIHVGNRIAAVTQHIPDKHFQMVRYYGFYSNRSRGQRSKACPELVEEASLLRPGDQPATSAQTPDVTVLDVTNYKPSRIPSKTWRELIKKIREVDPLSCPRCGHEMKIISLINDPDVVERILHHLGLWKQHPPPYDMETKAPANGRVVMEDFDDGWPGYEEPVIVYH